MPAPSEIIVVADGDTADDAQVAASFGAQVLRIPVAQGPAQARNLGANHASGEILFFVDADVAIAFGARNLGLLRSATYTLMCEPQ